MKVQTYYISAKKTGKLYISINPETHYICFTNNYKFALHVVKQVNQKIHCLIGATKKKKEDQ
jgi:hypothetical protein